MSFFDTISSQIKSVIAEIPEIANTNAPLENIAIEIPKTREFGDFSTNAAMILTRAMRIPPRDIAAIIIPYISALTFVSDVSVAGPGFINIKVRDEFIIHSMLNTKHEKTDTPMIIDMDYGSYNVAKSLHIGHLRPGVVGDAMYRIARDLGHKPISYNHMGDWGRPMALVIAWIWDLHPDWPFFQTPFVMPDDLSPYQIDAERLNTFYPASSARAKSDPEYMECVRMIKAELQNGNPGYTALYNIFLPISLAQMDNVICRLNMLPFDRPLGEKNAAKYLGATEEILRKKNMIEKSDGAEIIVVRREDDNAPMPPLMWLDSRGGDTYDSTDLAAIYYRKITDNPDKILYFTDTRQNLHFQQVFRGADMAGIMPYDKMEHIGFGTINGADGGPFKTRGGETPELIGILDMVENAVRMRAASANKDLSKENIADIALSAIKFNDYLHDVRSDYIFDPDAITSFEGRTGPYILYTAVRLKSVLARASDITPKLSDNLAMDERNLLLTILDFPRVLGTAFARRAPDILANYIYDLAQLTNTFYHNCPIMRDDIDNKTRQHRLAIVEKTLGILERGIDLMGMRVPDKM
ncbi:MAG: arginine--tRNA ligase [Rickettsiales bacterium]|jgi:arginyl-tRNA synthetase|nr:arginine--tRNA ligase [Rickettsiales bacterium]